MGSDRDIDKMVSGMELKKGAKREVLQYARGMKDGMHMAYVSVARRLLSEGQTPQEVKSFFADMTDAAERKEILKEAQSE